MQNNIDVKAKRVLFFLLLTSLSMLAGCSQEMPTPQNWSEGIRVKRNALSESQTVEDWKSMSTLFTYHAFPTAQPITVRSIDGDKWIAVFEKPSLNRVASTVTVERIGENEYRVVIHPNSGTP